MLSHCFQLLYVRKNCPGAELSEARTALSSCMAGSGQNAHERHFSGLSGKRVIDVVADIQRHARISSIQYFQQPVRRGLRIFNVFHRDDLKKAAQCVAIQCVIQLVPETSRENGEFRKLCQTFNARAFGKSHFSAATFPQLFLPQ